MNTVYSSCIPFPNIFWWSMVRNADSLVLDKAEHFQKMSYRNRYYITGANGLILLAIPLEQGREQRKTMRDVVISDRERWQVQHWRTLVSVYNRTSYFEFYENSLKVLFDNIFTNLADFNAATIQWVCQQLGLKAEIHFAETFHKTYDSTDLRNAMKPGREKTPVPDYKGYYQVFNERNGFLPNLSILDLLFAEGPHAMKWIEDNEVRISEWNVWS